jgi:hypothetical protein
MTQFEVRVAALLALRNSIGILIATMLLVPVDSVINRIFDGTWYVNWRLMLTVSGILTVLFFSFFFLAQVLEASTHGHRERTRKLVFPAVMWLRGIYLIAIVMGLCVMVGEYHEGDPSWIVMLPAAFVLIGFFAWPRAVEISDNEVQQHRIFFGFKRIHFREIERLVYDPARNEVVVFGKSGNRITHTMMHVDGERFMEQLESLTGKRVYSVGDVGQSSLT